MTKNNNNNHSSVNRLEQLKTLKKEKREKQKLKEKDITKDTPSYLGHRERLRQRFLLDNGVSMPDYELLELLLTFAIPRRDVKPLAKQLLKKYPNLAGVISADIEDVLGVEGVGINVGVLFKLVQVCSTKICWESLENNDAICLSSKRDVVEYCRSSIGHASQENLLTIFLNAKGGVLGKKVEAVGTVDAVMICPRNIAENALRFKAVSVILCHNHPSGDCTPSKADIEMTHQVKKALGTLGIILDDHIIVSSKGFYSMRERLDLMRF